MFDVNIQSDGSDGGARAWPKGRPRQIAAFVVAAVAFSGLLAAIDSGRHLHMAETAAPSGASRPATIVKPISCQKLPNVPGKSLTLALVDYPPDAYTPRHRHPGSVSAFVVKGTLRSQLDGQPAGTYRAGETWFEPPGAIHLFAENASKTEPAEILAMFVADDDCGSLVIPD